MMEVFYDYAAFWLPFVLVATSALSGAAIFFVREDRVGRRAAFNIAGGVIEAALIALMLWGVYMGVQFETRVALLPGLDLVLSSSALAMLFVTLSGGLWTVTAIYAIGYLRKSHHRSRFFGFFGLCVSATTGVALAGNLLTFVIFYELLTLATYPLIVHNETHEARRAGRIYLAYTLSGGALLLFGIIWLHAIAGPFEFTDGGALTQMGQAPDAVLAVIFFVMVAGLGVKAALVPFHGWLPIAMAAPAPVSALLHAVAVVKAGAFGIVRLVYDVYGLELVGSLGVDGPLVTIAGVTVIYGSVVAMYQKNIKKLLAYSTVSQLSYIILGVATLGPVTTIGGLVHLVHQGIMKITLFFCAGIFETELHAKQIHQMDGIGKRLPLTMFAFTIAALAMIGLPPLAGFVSKWYLGIGAIAAGRDWVVWVLVVSTVLNAAYFLPLVYRGWFAVPSDEWEDSESSPRFEAHPTLLFATVTTATFVIFVGVAANSPASPLEWVKIVAGRFD